MADHKGKILVIDNYSKEDTAAVQEIEKAITAAGYKAERIKHSDAKQKLAAGEDLLENYHGAVSSGSGKTWKETGEMDANGKPYVAMNDPVHDFLVEHEKPLYAICGAYHAVANSLGYKVKNTGEFNRGKGEDGHHYNHKYAIAKDDIDDKVKAEFTSHNGEEIVKAFTHQNNRAVQYHPERSEHGRQEIADFLDNNVKPGNPGENYQGQGPKEGQDPGKYQSQQDTYQ